MRHELVLILLATLATPMAAAQDIPSESEAPAEPEAPADEKSDADRARDAFMGGRTHYNLGNFEAALKLFAAAYELNPAPLLLFNLGQCHRQLKNHERAVFFFDGYLREDPETSDRDLVLGLIEEEKRFLGAQRAEAEMAKVEAEAEAAAKLVGDPIVEPRPEAADSEADDAWVPWAIGGGVVVAAAAGVTVAVLALSPQGRQGLAPPTFGELDLR